MSFVVLQCHTLLVAIFTDEAEFTSALFVVPRVASLRPNVDTLLVAGAVVRLSGTPLAVVHEAEGPQLARFRRNVLPDLLRGSVHLPVPDVHAWGAHLHQMSSRP